jgi:hypothetical protein
LQLLQYLHNHRVCKCKGFILRSPLWFLLLYFLSFPFVVAVCWFFLFLVNFGAWSLSFIGCYSCSRFLSRMGLVDKSTHHTSLKTNERCVVFCDVRSALHVANIVFFNGLLSASVIRLDFAPQFI